MRPRRATASMSGVALFFTPSSAVLAIAWASLALTF
jgi:hypothetical protein